MWQMNMMDGNGACTTFPFLSTTPILMGPHPDLSFSKYNPPSSWALTPENLAGETLSVGNPWDYEPLYFFCFLY